LNEEQKEALRAWVIVISPRAQARLFDRPARTVVTGLRLLEQVQHMLRAVGRLHGKKVMIRVL